jgi:hypothetical protein
VKSKGEVAGRAAANNAVAAVHPDASASLGQALYLCQEQAGKGC